MPLDLNQYVGKKPALDLNKYIAKSNELDDSFKGRLLSAKKAAQERKEQGIESIRRGVRIGEKEGGSFLQSALATTGGIGQAIGGAAFGAIGGFFKPEIEKFKTDVIPNIKKGIELIPESIRTAKPSEFATAGKPPIPEEAQQQLAESAKRLIAEMPEEKKQAALDFLNTLEVFNLIPVGLAAKKGGELTVKGAKGAFEMGKKFLPKAGELLEESAQKAFLKDAKDIATRGLGELSQAEREGVARRVSEKFFGQRSIMPTNRELSATEEVARMLSEGKIKKGQSTIKHLKSIDKEIGSLADELDTKLGVEKVMGTGGKITSEQYNSLLDGVEEALLGPENITITGDAVTSARGLLNKARSLAKGKKELFALDILNIRKELDDFVKSQKGTSVFDPKQENALSLSLRELRQTLNDQSAQLSSSTEVLDLLRRQTALFEAEYAVSNRFKKEATNVFYRLMSKIPIVNVLPKSEIIEAGTAIGLASTAIYGVLPAITGTLATGLVFKKGFGWVLSPKHRQFLGRLLLKLDKSALKAEERKALQELMKIRNGKSFERKMLPVGRKTDEGFVSEVGPSGKPIELPRESLSTIEARERANLKRSPGIKRDVIKARIKEKAEVKKNSIKAKIDAKASAKASVGDIKRLPVNSLIKETPDQIISQKNIESLTSQIKTEGDIFPIQIDNSGRILDGHHRFEIAKKLGIKEVPTFNKETFELPNLGKGLKGTFEKDGYKWSWSVDENIFEDIPESTFAKNPTKYLNENRGALQLEPISKTPSSKLPISPKL